MFCLECGDKQDVPFQGSYNVNEILYPVYVMKQLGIKNLIFTITCGGINTSFEPGIFMLINYFINLMEDNSLIGVNDESFGQRFPDMSEPYKFE